MLHVDVTPTEAGFDINHTHTKKNAGYTYGSKIALI